MEVNFKNDFIGTQYALCNVRNVGVPQTFLVVSYPKLTYYSMTIKQYFDAITEQQIAQVMASLEPDIVLGFKDSKPSIYCVDGWENETNCFVCYTEQFFELFRLSGSTNKYILEYV